VSYPADTLQS